MKNANTIRTQLGLTQKEMAHYLQINRSQLTMYENGKRDLPTQALVKLADMELFLINYKAQQQNETMAHEAAQLQKAEAIVAQHQKELAYQQLLLQKKLESVQYAYQQNIHLLQFVSYLEQKKSPAAVADKSWLQAMKSNAIGKIEANGLHHQAKIKLALQMHTPQPLTNFINNLRKLLIK